MRLCLLCRNAWNDCGVKSSSNGSGPSLQITCIRVIDQPHPAEFTSIVENQPCSIFKVEDQAVVGLNRLIHFLHAQIPAHTQVDQQGFGGKIDQDKLASPLHLAYRQPAYLAAKSAASGIAIVRFQSTAAPAILRPITPGWTAKPPSG